MGRAGRVRVAPLLPFLPSVPPLLQREFAVKRYGDTFGCISNLSPVQLRNMLVTAIAPFGRSCLSEPFRTFSGLTP